MNDAVGCNALAAAPIPVLFVHYGEDHIRGSEQVLLDLFANLDRSRIRPLLWCNTSILADAARRHGVDGFVSPMHYANSIKGFWSQMPQLRRQIAFGLALVRRSGARIIHANSAAPVQWMVPVARTARVPLLAHLHTAYIRRNLYLMLVHQASLIVGVSNIVLDELLRGGIEAGRMRVIGNGIDPRRLEGRSGTDPRVRLGIPADAFVVGTAGSLIPRKATALVLKAFAMLRHHRTPWLLVAGDGPDRAELVSLAAELHIADRTTFVGAYHDAASIFRAMDVHVLASMEEAFGLVLVEAAMCGVPSVASRVGGIVKIITHGRTGLLAAAGDTEAFAAALQMLADDASLRDALALAARDDAVTRFGAPRMAAELHAAYADLLALPAGRAGWLGTWRNAGPYARLLVGRRARTVTTL